MTEPIRVAPVDVVYGAITAFDVDLPDLELRGPDGEIFEVPAGRYEARPVHGGDPFLARLILADGTPVLVDMQILAGGRVQVA